MATHGAFVLPGTVGAVAPLARAEVPAVRATPSERLHRSRQLAGAAAGAEPLRQGLRRPAALAAAAAGAALAAQRGSRRARGLRRAARRARPEEAAENDATEASAAAVEEQASETPAEEQAEGAKKDAAKKVKAPKQVYPQHLRSVEVRRGIRAKTMFQGEVQMMRNTHFMAHVKCEGGEQFMVKGTLALNRAVDGDIVVLERLDRRQAEAYEAAAQSMCHGMRKETEEESLQRMAKEDTTATAEFADIRHLPRARVVSIIKRQHKTLVGTFLKEGETIKDGPTEVPEGMRVFVPANKRFPFGLARVPPDAENIDDVRVEVMLNVWDRYTDYPQVLWTSTIGPIGDIEVETRMILEEHSINNAPFSEEVLACLPPQDFKPSEDDIEEREDFRDALTFSIDPPGCEDIDDALSVEYLDNGNFRIGVHIADVSHFIKPGTALDKEAAARATSVYLVDRRIDMLPRLLTTDICSLKDTGDRLAFSCIFEITPGAVIKKEQFCKSVIRSDKQLSYKDAQDRLEGMVEPHSDISKAIKTLYSISVQLRRRRMEQGALQITSDAVKFELDNDTKMPTNLVLYDHLSTCELIEEYMLLANVSAAKFTSDIFRKHAVLRAHDAPCDENMEVVSELLTTHGIRGFKWGSSKELQDSLSTISKPDDPFFNQLVQNLCVRGFNEAQYINSGTTDVAKWNHFGLAAPKYTHFTSPIRRYADVLVHRLISACLGLEPLSEDMQSIDVQRALLEKVNFRNRMARWADFMSVALHQSLFFKENKGVVSEGVVMGVTTGGIVCAVQEYGVEGRIVVDKKDWHIIPDRMTAHGRPLSPYEGYSIKIFDRIIVGIEASDADVQQRTITMKFLGLPSDKGPMEKINDLVDAREQVAA